MVHPLPIHMRSPSQRQTSPSGEEGAPETTSRPRRTRGQAPWGRRRPPYTWWPFALYVVREAAQSPAQRRVSRLCCALTARSAALQGGELAAGTAPHQLAAKRNTLEAANL